MIISQVSYRTNGPLVNFVDRAVLLFISGQNDLARRPTLVSERNLY